MSHVKNATFFEEGNKVTPENLKHVFHAVIRSHAQRIAGIPMVKSIMEMIYIKSWSQYMRIRFHQSRKQAMTKTSVDILSASLGSEKKLQNPTTASKGSHQATINQNKSAIRQR